MRCRVRHRLAILALLILSATVVARTSVAASPDEDFVQRTDALVDRFVDLSIRSKADLDYAQSWAATLRLALGLREKAQKTASTIPAGDHRKGIFNRISRDLVKSGRYDEAIAIARDEELEPADRRNLISLLAERGAVGEAQQVIDLGSMVIHLEALQADLDYLPSAYRTIAEACAKRGDRDEAREYAERTATLLEAAADPDAADLGELAGVRILLGEEVAPLFARIDELGDQQAYLPVVEAYLHVGKVGDAFTIARRIAETIESDDEFNDAAQLAAETIVTDALTRGDADTAMNVIREPALTRYVDGLALLAAQRYAKPETRRQWEAFLELCEDDRAAALIAMAQATYEAGDAAAARRLLDEARGLETEQEAFDVDIQLATVAAAHDRETSTSRLAFARMHASRMNQEDHDIFSEYSSHGQVLVAIANVERVLGNNEEAIATLEDAVDLLDASAIDTSEYSLEQSKSDAAVAFYELGKIDRAVEIVGTLEIYGAAYQDLAFAGADPELLLKSIEKLPLEDRPWAVLSLIEGMLNREGIEYHRVSRGMVFGCMALP